MQNDAQKPRRKALEIIGASLVRRMNSPESAQAGSSSLESEGIDPDLNTKAAREIMGWQVIEIAWAGDQTVPVWHDAKGDPMMSEFSWRPDRDEAQNMQILDAMLDLGYDFDLSVKRDHAVARFVAGSNRLGQSLNPDRKLAVIEAALEAIRSCPRSTV
ncbi:hypothetical protein [Thioalkalivibrio sp. HK1]|uniref:hypothetical protein n=1 Tax=Thioalkalivibrio sp. HK1 TaxID=1469245 RepID=UPI0012DE02F6|nr:hypothetical protein [Thioalkalivibrio sp. HK1]